VSIVHYGPVGIAVGVTMLVVFGQYTEITEVLRSIL
jgi:hypothetical protein